LFGKFHRLVIRSATIEEIEAEKSAIETDVVRSLYLFWLLFSGNDLDVILVFWFVQSRNQRWRRLLKRFGRVSTP